MYLIFSIIAIVVKFSIGASLLCITFFYMQWILKNAYKQACVYKHLQQASKIETNDFFPALSISLCSMHQTAVKWTVGGRWVCQLSLALFKPVLCLSKACISVDFATCKCNYECTNLGWFMSKHSPSA